MIYVFILFTLFLYYAVLDTVLVFAFMLLATYNKGLQLYPTQRFAVNVL